MSLAATENSLSTDTSSVEQNGTKTREEYSTEKRDPSQDKPVVSREFMKDFLYRVYGMKVISWTELNSYDDRNYHIEIDRIINNDFIGDYNEPGYVLKILNSNDSKSPIVIDIQHQMLMHLQKKGLNVQDPVRNVFGQTWSLETVPDEINPECVKGPYVFHVLKYVEGNIVVNEPYHPTTLYNIGVFAGQMHKALQDFNDPYLKDRTFLWSLKELPALSEYTYVIKDKENLELVNHTIKAFKEEVEPLYEKLTKGCIHGDLNEQNIIVKPRQNRDITKNERICDVTTFIDFADTTDSYTVFDVAILIAYMSIDSLLIDPLDVGGHILAGYFTEMTLNATEIDVLRICVCSRLIQSLVMGAYSYFMNPKNEYVLATSKRGWAVLWKYWQTPNCDLIKRWDNIIKNYQTM